MKGFQPFRRMYVGLKLELSLKESNLPQACFEKDFQNMLGSEVVAVRVRDWQVRRFRETGERRGFGG